MARVIASTEHQTDFLLPLQRLEVMIRTAVIADLENFKPLRLAGYSVIPAVRLIAIVLLPVLAALTSHLMFLIHVQSRNNR